MRSGAPSAAGDRPAVRAVVRDAARDGYRWSAVIRGVVTSVPFTMGLAAAPQPADSAGVVAVRSEALESVR